MNGAVVSTCISSLVGINRRPSVAVGQLNWFLKYSAQRSNRRSWGKISAISLLNHFDGVRLPWISTLNQSVKAVTIVYGCSLFHFPTISYSPLFAAITQAIGQLTFRRFVHLIVCSIRSKDLLTSNGLNEFEDNHRSWGLHGLESWVPVASVYRVPWQLASLSWALRKPENCFGEYWRLMAV